MADIVLQPIGLIRAQTHLLTAIFPPLLDTCLNCVHLSQLLWGCLCCSSLLASESWACVRQRANL